MTDFDYRLDLTRFIFPFGYIDASADRRGRSVPAVVEAYLRDGNMLKSLEMKKEVSFDWRALEAMIHGHVRRLGWWRGLRITFPRSNYTVRVLDQNLMSTIWENPCTNCLLHVTIVPCILFRCYRDCGGHAKSRIRSHFRIDYHSVQIFESIKPMLWCPGFSGMRMAQELYRDFFW